DLYVFAKAQFNRVLSFSSQADASQNKKIGLALAIIAGDMLSVSYASSSIILTFIGLGFALWSIISLYAMRSDIVLADLFVSASVASANMFRSIVTDLGYNGNAIFLYPKSFEGMNRGYVFISKS